MPTARTPAATTCTAAASASSSCRRATSWATRRSSTPPTAICRSARRARPWTARTPRTPAWSTSSTGCCLVTATATASSPRTSARSSADGATRQVGSADTPHHPVGVAVDDLEPLVVVERGDGAVERAGAYVAGELGHRLLRARVDDVRRTGGLAVLDLAQQPVGRHGVRPAGAGLGVLDPEPGVGGVALPAPRGVLVERHDGGTGPGVLRDPGVGRHLLG